MAGNAKYEYWLTEEGLLQVEAWGRDGLTNEDIAHNMGIAVGTLYDWRKKYPLLDDALKKSRAVADIRIENALYKKATGYTVEVQKAFKVRRVEYDPDTGKRLREYEEIVLAPDNVHIPADTVAQIFWLKNRKPNDWRDKREQQIDVNDGKETGVVLMAPVLEEENGTVESDT